MQEQNITRLSTKKNLNVKENKNMLFFSNFCIHSKELLGNLKKKNHLDSVQLISVDNRYIKDNITMIQLNETQTMSLPPMITCVPTLCMLPNYEILQGSKIMDYFAPLSENIGEARKEIHSEPNAFSLESETNGSFGVSSDNFSFWDTSTDELSAQGNAGIMQMYTYASVNNQGSGNEIQTPAEEASENKLTMNLEQLQQKRINEI
tara:strand:- start:117 stop:734 length:618 start_codon:yes stop_codon:yes gene_type:complete